MIQDFATNVLQHQRMFFMLQDLSGPEEITLTQTTPEGDIPFEEFKSWRMANGSIMLSFKDPFLHSTKLNLIAHQGGQTEVVNLQTYERILPYYRATPASTDGAFVFCKSKLISLPGLDWRCDTQFFGPRLFDEEGTADAPIISDLDRILVYESILNIVGVGHLLFIHLKDDADEVEYITNNMIAPAGARTLSEAYRQVWEWAQTTNEPWNNQQDIAVTAKSFLEQTGFSSIIGDKIADQQVDMQVSRYLQGYPDARVRPTGILPLSTDLEVFTARKMSYMTLSALIELFPEAAEVADCLAVDREHFETDEARAVQLAGLEAGSATIADKEMLHDAMLENAPGAAAFWRLKMKVLATQKDEIDRLEAVYGS